MKKHSQNTFCFKTIMHLLVPYRHVQNQILIGRDWYVIYTRSWFRSCMGLRLRSRLGNFGKISRDFGKYSSRPGFSVYNLGKITEIWSRLIFFVYCSLNLNTVIVLLPRKRREKRPRSRNSRSNRDPGLDLRHRNGHVWERVRVGKGGKEWESESQKTSTDS